MEDHFPTPSIYNCYVTWTHQRSIYSFGSQFPGEVHNFSKQTNNTLAYEFVSLFPLQIHFVCNISESRLEEGRFSWGFTHHSFLHRYLPTFC